MSARVRIIGAAGAGDASGRADMGAGKGEALGGFAMSGAARFGISAAVAACPVSGGGRELRRRGASVCAYHA